MQYIQQLDGDYQNAFLFVLQAKNPEGVALTGSQLDGAINAAKASLELLGAEVSATCALVPIETATEGTTARLVCDITVEELEQ